VLDPLKLLRQEERGACETYFESRARAVYQGNDRLLCRVLGSYPIVADARDNAVTPHLALDGYWEIWCSIAVARYVKAGMRVVDVGAAAGYYTVLLGHLVGEGGRVQSWEPEYFTVDCLRRSVELNGLDRRTDIIAAAASSEDVPHGGARLVVDSTTNMGSAEVVIGGTLHGQPIGCSRLDDRGGAPPDFIKIDAEGHEERVWDGAQKCLGAPGARAVLLEFTPRKHKAPGEFLQRITSIGYSLGTVTADGSIKPTTAAELEKLSPSANEMLWCQKRG